MGMTPACCASKHGAEGSTFGIIRLSLTGVIFCVDMCRTMLHSKIHLFTCSSKHCLCWHICTANITVGNMYDKYVSYWVPKKPSRSSILGGDGLHRCWPRGGREGPNFFLVVEPANIHVCIYAIASDLVSQTQKSGPRGESMDHRLSCEQCAGQSGGWWRWWLRCGPNRVVTGEPVPCEMGIQVIAVLGWRRLKKMCLIHSWTDEKVMWGGDPVEKFRFFIRKELSHSIQGVWTPTKDQRKSEVEEPHDMYTLNQRGEQAQAPRIFVLLKSCILLVFKGMR